MKNKKTLVVLLLVTAAVFIGLAYYLINRSQKQYRILSLKSGPITEAIYGLGTVRANQTFSFKVGVPKTIKSISIKEGSPVQKGETLLSFEDGSKVTSPIDGTVLDLPYHAGENVFTEKPVIVVENLKDLFIEARLDQQGTLRVKSGLSVKLNFESIRNKIFEGKVHSLYPNNGEFVARIEVEGLPPEILPGMTADVSIEVAEKSEALLVPIQAVSSGLVLRSREGVKEKIPVEIGIRDDEWAEVIGGDLKLTDEVLIKR